MTFGKDGTLFAWTSVGDYQAYPQYVNVSRRNGKVVITVRALEDTSGEYPVMGAQASCTLPNEELVMLVIALHAELDPALTRLGIERGLLDASGMSAFGQDAEERLEAKPASPAPKGDAHA